MPVTSKPNPALGRMTGVDAMAGKYSSVTPYNYAFNDPVGLNDPSSGDDVYIPTGTYNMIMNLFNSSGNGTTTYTNYNNNFVQSSFVPELPYGGGDVSNYRSNGQSGKKRYRHGRKKQYGYSKYKKSIEIGGKKKSWSHDYSWASEDDFSDVWGGVGGDIMADDILSELRGPRSNGKSGAVRKKVGLTVGLGLDRDKAWKTYKKIRNIIASNITQEIDSMAPYMRTNAINNVLNDHIGFTTGFPDNNPLEQYVMKFMLPNNMDIEDMGDGLELIGRYVTETILDGKIENLLNFSPPLRVAIEVGETFVVGTFAGPTGKSLYRQAQQSYLNILIYLLDGSK